MPKVNEGHQFNLEVIESHLCNLEYCRAICGTFENNSIIMLAMFMLKSIYMVKRQFIDSTLDNVNNLEENILRGNFKRL